MIASASAWQAIRTSTPAVASAARPMLPTRCQACQRLQDDFERQCGEPAGGREVDRDVARLDAGQEQERRHRAEKPEGEETEFTAPM